MTLLEVMIAMAIGAFLIAGTLQLYVGSKRSYTIQNAMMRMHETGRYTVSTMTTDLRMAGFMGCATNTTLANTVNAGTGWQYALDRPVFGFDGGVSTFPSEFASLVVPGTDAIVLVRAEPNDDYVIDSHVPTSATIKLKNTHDLKQSEVLVATDCQHTAVFQMSNTNNNNTIKDVVHNTGTLVPGNCTKGLGYPVDCSTTNGNAYKFEEDALLMRLTSRAYFIGTGASGRPALFRMTLQSNGLLGGAQELVDGVEDMQVLYGLDADGDRAVDQYVTASAIAAADWADVVSIQVNWLVQTSEERLADQPTPYVLYDGTTASLTPVTPTDSRLRRVFSSTIAVRNRAL